MRLLAYVLGVAFARTLAVWVILCLVVWSIDVVEASAFAPLSLTLALARLPISATYALPMAAALGPLLALSHLGRRGEWDAVASTGIAPHWLTLTLLLAPLSAALLCFVSASWLAPAGVALTRRLAAEVGSRHATPEEAPLGLAWSRIGNQLVGSGPADGCSVVVERASSGAAARLSRWCQPGKGESLTWSTHGGWLPGASAPPATTAAPLLERATPLNVLELPGGGLDRGELESAIRAANEVGRDVRPLVAESALRATLAWSCLAAALLALGLCIPQRRSPTQVLVARGIAVLAAYWLVAALAWNLVAAGALAPTWLSVGVPLGFSLLAGLVLYRSA